MVFLTPGRVTALCLLALTGCRHAPASGAPRATAVQGAALTCALPLPLGFGAPMRASTVGGLDKVHASCVRGDAPECVFMLEPSERAELRVGLETAGFDGTLSLFELTRGELHELRCVDDTPQGDVHHTRLDTTLAPGRYLLVVDGANREAGDFELFAELEPLPGIGEACGAAKPLVSGHTLRDSTRGGTNLFSATCGGGAQGPEHVHRIELAEPSRIRIRQQAEYDGALYIRARCEDASSELVCNDDFQSNARSLIAARLPAGSYYLFSDSYSREQSGDYVLAYEQIPEPKPTSVEAVCSELARAPITVGERELDTLYGSFAFSGSCGGRDTPELAIDFRVDAPTTLTAKLDNPEFNAVMYVRKNCRDANSELACFVAPRVDRPPNELELASPALVAPLERGAYTLVVDGYEAGDMGAATLELSFDP